MQAQDDILQVDYLDTLILEYFTEDKFISVDTLLSTTSQLVKIIKTINKYVDKNDIFEVGVQGVYEGSFRIKYPLHGKRLVDNPGVLAKISHILGIAASIVVIVSFLQGGKADNVVVNGDNNTVNIYKDGKQIEIEKDAWEMYTKDREVNDSLRKFVGCVEDESKITTVQLERESDGRSISIGKSDYKFYKMLNEYLEENTIIEKRRVLLKIINPSFDPKLMWKFTYNNRRINLRVEDEEFYQMVMNREYSFESGDALLVDVIVTLVYDEENDFYKEDEVRIIRVVSKIEYNEIHGVQETMRLE